jgi:hypothetical protein
MSLARARKLQHFCSDIFSQHTPDITVRRRYSSSADLSTLLKRSNSADSFCRLSTTLQLTDPQDISSPHANSTAKPKPARDDKAHQQERASDGVRTLTSGANQRSTSALLPRKQLLVKPSIKCLSLFPQPTSVVFTALDPCAIKYEVKRRIKALDYGNMNWYDSRTEVRRHDTRDISPQTRKLKQLQSSLLTPVQSENLPPSSKTIGRSYLQFEPSSRRVLFKNDLSKVRV